MSKIWSTVAGTLFVGVTALTLAASCQGAGHSLHIIMAYKAIDKVQDDDLRELLHENIHSLVIGVGLVDGGYINNYSYSEIAHWPPFHVAYNNYVRNKCGSALSSERCRPLIAHMMGMIAHGFQDESYDVLMNDRSKNIDDVHTDSFLETRDTLIDKYAMFDYNYALPLFPTAVSPLVDVYKVFRSMGHNNITLKQLKNGQQTIISIAAIERLITDTYSDLQDRKLYGWLRKSYRDQPGGVRFTSEALAKLWDFYWNRLHGQNTTPAPTLFPENGGNIEPDHNDPWGRVNYLSDRPLKTDSFRNNFYLIDLSSGKSVPGRIEDRQGYMVRFIPHRDLQPGTSYQVTVTSNIRDYWGKPVINSDMNWIISGRNNTRGDTDGN